MKFLAADGHSQASRRSALSARFHVAGLVVHLSSLGVSNAWCLALTLLLQVDTLPIIVAIKAYFRIVIIKYPNPKIS